MRLKLQRAWSSIKLHRAGCGGLQRADSASFKLHRAGCCDCKELDPLRAKLDVVSLNTAKSWSGESVFKLHRDVVDCKELIQCEYSNCTELDVVKLQSFKHTTSSSVRVLILDQMWCVWNCKELDPVVFTAQSWNCKELDQASIKLHTAGCGEFETGSSARCVWNCKELINCSIQTAQSWMWWVWILDQARVCLNCTEMWWTAKSWSSASIQTAQSWMLWNCKELDLASINTRTELDVVQFETAQSWIRRVLNCTELDVVCLKLQRAGSGESWMWCV